MNYFLVVALVGAGAGLWLYLRPRVTPAARAAANLASTPREKRAAAALNIEAESRFGRTKGPQKTAFGRR